MNIVVLCRNPHNKNPIVQLINFFINLIFPFYITYRRHQQKDYYEIITEQYEIKLEKIKQTTWEKKDY